jgi:hypothetical protein
MGAGMLGKEQARVGAKYRGMGAGDVGIGIRNEGYEQLKVGSRDMKNRSR